MLLFDFIECLEFKNDFINIFMEIFDEDRNGNLIPAVHFDGSVAEFIEKYSYEHNEIEGIELFSSAVNLIKIENFCLNSPFVHTKISIKIVR